MCTRVIKAVSPTDFDYGASVPACVDDAGVAVVDSPSGARRWRPLVGARRCVR